MLVSAAVRTLTPDDRGDVDELLARDPVAAVFVAARIRESGLLPDRTGSEVWGFHDGGRLVSLCYAGANLAPVEARPDAIEAFAAHARGRRRRCSSLLGPAPVVAELWRLLAPDWGPAREERMSQPVMVLEGRPPIAPDPAVTPTRLDHLDVLVPACEAMFTEEVGLRPYGFGGAGQYRESVAELVRSGRSYARFDRQGVVFKAEVGSVSEHACQVQGVWVAPAHRGRGLAAPGMAAVAEHARHAHAPLVTLYVNDYNTRAVAAYRRAGFTQTSTFATVLL